jgi:hypothetical protein
MASQQALMASTFAWLDHSDSDRRSMLEAISQFRERDTLDEIGIGSIRDAFANLLFPGTSVLQTRARYFLFIPWIYLNLERRRTSSADVGTRARQDEVKLIRALKRGDAGALGVIGGQVEDRVQLLPSRAYWQGLEVLGIRRAHGSTERYHRSLDAFYAGQHETLRSDDGELVDQPLTNWHPGLPDSPHDLLQECSFALTRAEAEYLRDRILERASGTAFAYFVSHGDRDVDVPFAWRHPQVGELPLQTRERLDAAHAFSDLIQGARLLYNVMVAEMSNSGELVEHVDRLEAWEGGLSVHAQQLASGNRSAFWQLAYEGNPRISGGARRFADRWSQLVAESAGRIGATPAARSLIQDREIRLKRGLARLDERNVRARENWGGTAGTNPLDYRWGGTVSRLVNDIRLGFDD